VVLCGDNAGQVPLPSDGDIRGAPRRTRASSTAVPVQAGTACAGDNILHAKLLTISSIDVNGDSAVFTSSQNLSQHSEQLAFNNALQLIGSAPMYQANVTYLHALRADTRSPDLGDAIDPLPVDTPIGSVTSAFFPRNSPAQFPADNSYDATNDRATDATAALLQHVSCTSPGTYAGDHAGTVPRTTVRIAVYSYGARNLVTKRLTALAGAGCEVQVIYTRMPLSTYDALVAGGITPVQLNDSSYQLPNGNTTRVFVHDKYLLISGAYNDGGTVVRNQDIVQTGSQNLTPVGLHHNDDEVMRVRQTASKNSNNTALFAAYEANWQHLLAVAGG
jgi:phosphatidylserine/phosphatidylglycerophosphate/cardiolipin synthase-like enzyme